MLKDSLCYLQDSLEAIDKIKRITGGQSYVDFVNSETSYDAVAYQLIIIGEAFSKVNDEIRNKHKEVQWRQIVSMRNRLVHGYDNIDKEIIWNTCKHDISQLDQQVKHIIQDMG